MQFFVYLHTQSHSDWSPMQYRLGMFLTAFIVINMARMDSNILYKSKYAKTTRLRAVILCIHQTCIVFCLVHTLMHKWSFQKPQFLLIKNAVWTKVQNGKISIFRNNHVRMDMALVKMLILQIFFFLLFYYLFICLFNFRVFCPPYSGTHSKSTY